VSKKICTFIFSTRYFSKGRERIRDGRGVEEKKREKRVERRGQERRY
jgi:hypothetical protein